MRISTVCVLHLFIFASNNIQAQNSIEISPLTGIKIFSPGNISLDGRSYGIEAAYNMNQEGRSPEWINRLRIRDIAVVAGYRNMGQVFIKDSTGSKGFLKNVYGLSGRLNVKIVKVNKTELLFIAGLGAVYTNTSFFTDVNPLVGSRFNYSAQGGGKN